ncbi:MAG: tetratricopeptide repeat protein [Brevinematales bacterium]|nr:tetratricopeptide repeat protein [Brevinematales bacterium]
MKKLWVILLFFSFYGCFKFNSVLPEDKLKDMSSVKIMELAAEKYQANEYKDAIYYYEYVIKNFSEDKENFAWAHYEIGFIKYQEGKLKEALDYFYKTASIDSPNKAPTILALQMAERVEKMLEKKGRN